MNNNAQTTKEKAIAQTDQMEEGILLYFMDCCLHSLTIGW